MAPPSRPQEQRVAAYAVILRDDVILLSRLADRLTHRELWTLPGGGVEHGEDPRVTVVREVHEETGLDATVGETARVFTAHQADAWRRGRRVDVHAIRIVYDAWVAPDAPEPRTLEVDGSTSEAAWHPVAAVLDGRVPTVGMVAEALAVHASAVVQRVAAYALVVRDERVLLARNSPRGPYPGGWSLPGGGIDHGESPRAALVREVAEETGLACAVGDVLEIGDSHLEGTAPSGRREDFHTVQLVFEASVAGDDEPRVVEVGGTTDAAAWVDLADLDLPDFPVRPIVRTALGARRRRSSR